MSYQTLEDMLPYTNKPEQEKKPRPGAEEAQKCPRCDSTNTKFCYYNNYSLTQPRYFCKSCRRYWTKGGTLRNIPVGGGCRKNKRTSSKRSQDLDQSMTSSPNYPLSSFTPLSCYDSSDLSLAIAKLQKQASGSFEIEENDMSMMCNTAHYDFFCAQRGGFLESTPNELHHNIYYGIDNNGNLGHIENGEIMGVNVSAEMEMQYDQEMSGGKIVKQEMCNIAREGENNRILWGFPWQINGEVNNMVDFESSSRQNWNGFDSSFHGLNHSSLIA